MDVVQCQVVSAEEVVLEEGFEECGVCDVAFVCFVKVKFVEVVSECGDRAVVVEPVIGCPRGQVRGETTNSKPLSLLEGSNGGLWSGVEEWMAERNGGVNSCGVESG